MKVSIWADSRIGRVRERQEDAFLVDRPLIAVADGMGGTTYGRETAQYAVLALATHKPRSVPDLLRVAKDVDESANLMWSGGGGSTLDVVLLGEVVEGIHAGDSRVYWGVKKGRGPTARRVLIQVTCDHSIGGRYLTNFVGKGQARFDPVRIPWALGNYVLLCSDGLTNELKDWQIADVLWSKTKNPALALTRAVTKTTKARDNVTAVVARRE